MKARSFLVTATTAALAFSAFADDAKPTAPAVAAGATTDKHVNAVTDAAKAAFEKMDKAANNPFAKGMKTAAGVLATTVRAASMSMKFTLSAPSNVSVEADPALKGDAVAAIAKASADVMRRACGVFEPAAGTQYDADVATKDGRSVLTVTQYENGVLASKTDYALDANGLIMSSASHATVTAGGQAKDVRTDAAYSWSRAADGWRLDKITTTSGPSKGSTKIVYADEAGKRLPVVWHMEGAVGALDVRVTELTVDGAKCDVSKTAAAEAPKGDKHKKSKKGKKGGDGDGEGEGEGEEDDGD